MLMQMYCSLSLSLVRFWGWSENKREEERDFAKLSQLAHEGKLLYSKSHQPQTHSGTSHPECRIQRLGLLATQIQCIPVFNLCITRDAHYPYPLSEDVFPNPNVSLLPLSCSNT